jgi:hypothetical protein
MNEHATGRRLWACTSNECGVVGFNYLALGEWQEDPFIARLKFLRRRSTVAH